MADVVETAWQPGRSAHGGHVEFQVTVYRRLGGIRGGTGVRTVGVRGSTGEPYSGGAAEKHGGTGVSPDPSNNSGGARGHPLAPLTN